MPSQIFERRPHLLYVAYSFPPARSAGMYRALATANAFAEAGWDVTVLTATRETFEQLTGTDSAMERSIDRRIDVVRIPFDPQRGEDDLRRWSRLRIFSSLLWNALRWVRFAVTFPERAYAVWYRPLVQEAIAIHQRKRVSLVLGTANPNVDLMPGDVLFRRFGVPYIVDHRDAWHLDVYTGERTAPRWSRSSRIERRIMNNAMEAWFVNEPIRDWHAREYPVAVERFHVVANGFDPDLLESERHRAPDPAALVFGYLGTIYGPIPLKETLQGWRLARSRSPIVARARLVFRGRLGHFAEADQQAAELLDSFRTDAVSYEGPVSKSDVGDVYASFDALLLIVSHSRYVTSGKVFEYAGTGLPIAALHDPETAATSVLRGHYATFPVIDVTPEHIADAIVATAECAARLSLSEIAAARDWAMQYTRIAQLMPRIVDVTARVTGTT